MKSINPLLTNLERDIIVNKATERPYTGEYDDFYKAGVFVCRNCNNPLYSSESKFDAGCGWPAFAACYQESVKQTPDSDGSRIEITCDRCEAHLGHVFIGERLTETNHRHCVNSASIKYYPTKKLILGCGCFWGVQHYFSNLNGIVDSKVGYYGGELKNPTYEDVCTGQTGHFEVIELEYIEELVSFEKIIKFFFEIHDFSQANGQGNDIGQQYKSVIFYNDLNQKQIVDSIIVELEDIVDRPVKTLVLMAKPDSIFYPAESYHQDYYAKNGQEPYCHFYKKIF
jgi:peptide methionine sulfoxide reductase msrA/msrB